MAGISDEVYRFTRQKLSYIEKISSSDNKALLAEIRHGAGKIPGDEPKLWGIVFEGMPESMMSKGKEPTAEEWAVYIALTLYAVHQQGHDVNSENMNKSKVGIGRAVAKLIKSEDDKERVERRFNCLATAENVEGASYYLRTLIHMLRKESIGIDYALLAKELYLYQFEEIAPSIRLRWGQDFYSEINKANKKESAENE